MRVVKKDDIDTAYQWTDTSWFKDFLIGLGISYKFDGDYVELWSHPDSKIIMKKGWYIVKGEYSFEAFSEEIFKRRYVELGR